MLDCASSLAQDPAPADKAQAFSVVSVKRNKDDAAGRPTFAMTSDGINLRNYTPMQLLISGFGLMEQRRVIGAPPWMNDELYDVAAKVDDADIAALARVPRADRYLMLQQVLVTRFNLKYHYESRNFNVFELTVAKSGPKLSLSKSDSFVSGRLIGHEQYKAEGMSMNELCLMILSTEAQAFVVDKTGFTGRYDFTLQWSRPDELVNGAPSDQPLIFTAVQEQLGLKMVPAIVPTKVLVIDHIERPSEN